jgi:ABC-type transport system substrate-binding protein
MGPQWRELGVRVRQDWVGFEQMEAETKLGSSFWEWGWVSDYPDPQGMLETFLLGSPTPLADDPELLGLLERARTLRTRDERLELYRAVDRRLVAERVSVIPAFYDRWDILRRPYVEGLWAHPQGIAPLEGVVVRR